MTQPLFPSTIGTQSRSAKFLTIKLWSEKRRSDRVPALSKAVLPQGPQMVRLQCRHSALAAPAPRLSSPSVHQADARRFHSTKFGTEFSPRPCVRKGGGVACSLHGPPPVQATERYQINMVPPPTAAETTPWLAHENGNRRAGARQRAVPRAPRIKICGQPRAKKNFNVPQPTDVTFQPKPLSYALAAKRYWVNEVPNEYGSPAHWGLAINHDGRHSPASRWHPNSTSCTTRCSRSTRFFFLAQTKMSWRSPLTSQYLRRPLGRGRSSATMIPHAAQPQHTLSKLFSKAPSGAGLNCFYVQQGAGRRQHRLGARSELRL